MGASLRALAATTALLCCEAPSSSSPSSSPSSSIVAAAPDSTGAPTGALAIVARWGETRLKTGDLVGATASIPGTSLFATTSRLALTVWSWRTGEEVWASPLETDNSPVVAAPDGKTLAVERKAGETTVFDVARRRPVRSVPGGSPLYLSAGGALLATFHRESATYQLWDLGRGEKLWERKGRAPHSFELTSGSWTSATDGMTGFVASADGQFATTATWDTSRSRCELSVMELRTLQGRHSTELEACPRAVRFAGDRRLVAVGNEVVLWSFEQSKTPRRLPLEIANAGNMDGASISQREDRVVMWSTIEVVVWDVASGKRTWNASRTRPDPSQRVQVDFSPDGRFVVATAWTKKEGLIVWDAATGQQVFALEGGGGDLRRSTVFDDGGTRLAVPGLDRIGLVQVATGREEPPPPRFAGYATALAAAGDGRTLAVGYLDGSLALLDGATAKALRPRVTEWGTTFGDIAFSRDGAEVAAVVDDRDGRRAQIWDVASGKHARTITTTITVTGKPSPGRVRILPGAEQILVAESGAARAGRRRDGGRVVTAFARATGERLSSRRTRPPGDDYLMGQIGPDGTWAAVAGHPSGLRIVDLASGRMKRQLDPTPAAADEIALSADGRVVVEVARDGTTRAFDTGSGKALRTWKANGGFMPRLALSPDGRWLAIGQWTGTLQLWAVDSGTLAGTWDLGARVDFPAALLFTGDGQQLVVGTARGLVYRLTVGR
jgi:WD40 repeat protein